MNKNDIEQMIRLATKEHQHHNGYDFVKSGDRIDVTGSLFGYRLYLYIDTFIKIDDTFEFNINKPFIDAVTSHFTSELFVASGCDASSIWILVKIAFGKESRCDVTVGLGKTREFEYHSSLGLYTFSLDVEYVDEDDDCVALQGSMTSGNLEKLIKKSEEL